MHGEWIVGQCVLLRLQEQMFRELEQKSDFEFLNVFNVQ